MARTIIPLLAVAIGCSPNTETAPLFVPSRIEKAPPIPQVEVIERAGLRNVRILREDTWVQVTQFTRPEHVYEAAVSPSGRWLLVWHMARTPRVLSIYDLRTLALHRQWIPGFGGDLHWTAHDTIFHRWGAGVSCRCWAIYSTDGRVMNQGVCDNLSESPDRAFALLYPQLSVSDRSVVLVDLGCGRLQTVERLHDPEYVVEALWKDDRTAVLDVGTFEGERRTLEVAAPRTR